MRGYGPLREARRLAASLLHRKPRRADIAVHTSVTPGFQVSRTVPQCRATSVPGRARQPHRVLCVGEDDVFWTANTRARSKSPRLVYWLLPFGRLTASIQIFVIMIFSLILKGNFYPFNIAKGVPMTRRGSPRGQSQQLTRTTYNKCPR